MPSTLKVANWREWQSYRSDRGQPPWIKVHRRLLRNPEWVQLGDAARAHLVSIWILAADKDGEVPDSAELIQRLCYLESPPDLDKLASLGFLVRDKRRRRGVTVASERRQDDAPEAEAEAEAEADETRGRARATRWRDEDTVPEDWMAWAQDELGMTPAQTYAERDRFVDHWLAKSGKDATKADWEASVAQDWCRRAPDFVRSKPNGPSRPARAPCRATHLDASSNDSSEQHESGTRATG